jgi:hypothetical protein
VFENGVSLTADIPTTIAEKVVVVAEHEVLEVIGQDISEEVAFEEAFLEVVVFSVA